MFEIGKDEFNVMNCMVHAEYLETVIQECGLKDKVVIDIIRHLRHHRFVKPVDENGRELAMFEADKIRRVRFMLTAKGYSALEVFKENPGSKKG